MPFANGGGSQFGRTTNDSTLLPTASAGQTILSQHWNLLLHALVRVEKGGDETYEVCRTMQFAGEIGQPACLFLQWSVTTTGGLSVVSGTLNSAWVQSQLGGQVSTGSFFHQSSVYQWSCVYLYDNRTDFVVPAFGSGISVDRTGGTIEYWLRPIDRRSIPLPSGTFRFSLMAIVPT